MSRIAVIGLGAMGERIASRLLGAGHDLVVWNRTAEKAVLLTDLGAEKATTAADAATGADVVLTMVSDPEALRGVTEGPTGVAAAIGDSATLIEMSTVGPPAVSRLAGVLPAGTGLLDAPVIGSLAQAEAGALTIFVGGPTPLVERWTPLLSILGRPIHVGALGSGAAAKLVANSTLLATLGVFGEALALADGLGLSRDVAYEVLATTPMAAQVERRRGAIESGEFPPRFTLSLARKDAELIVAAAEAAGVDLRLGAAAHSWLAAAEDDGRGAQDYSALLAHILGSR